MICNAGIERKKEGTSVMDMRGKVALITGGGTGLGRAVALLFAREGVNVAVHYSRSRDEALETVGMLEALGVQAMAVQADLNAETMVADCKRVVEEVTQKFGRLDILVNNAGTTRNVAFTDIDGLVEEDWDRVLNVNTKAPFFMTQAAAAVMRRNGSGQVINTASVAGLGTTGSSIAYAVSKAGLIHLTKCLAVALAPDIRVNAVAPGLLLTRWSAIFPDAVIQAVTQRALLKKDTDVEDTAAVFVMLAKNESMTGQVVTVDAGMTV